MVKRSYEDSAKDVAQANLPNQSLQVVRTSNIGKRKKSIHWKFSPLVKECSTCHIISQIDDDESTTITLAQSVCSSPKATKTSLGLWKSPDAQKERDIDMPMESPGTPSRIPKSSTDKGADLAGINLQDIEDLSFGTPISSELDFLNTVGLEGQANNNLDYHVESRMWKLRVFEVEHNRRTKILHCRRLEDEQIVYLELGDFFSDCDYEAGNLIHVVGKNLSCPKIYLKDPNEFFLVLYPGHTVSITTISDAVTCLRKATISTLMLGAHNKSPPTTHLATGLVVHEIFAETLIQLGTLHTKPDILGEMLERAIQRNVLTIYACGIDEGQILPQIRKVLCKFPLWWSKFLRSEPHTDAKLVDEAKCNLPPSSRNACIPTVFAMEENITSATYGLKGKMDALVLLRYQGQDPNQLVSILVPLELKTGISTNSVAHRAQTLLYTLLLADRFNLDINFGLLYYMSSDMVLRIQASSADINSLLMLRNRIVANLVKKNIPPPINHPQQCRQCSHLYNCAALQRIVPANLSVTNATLGNILEGASRLENEDLAFYHRWNRFLNLEEETCRETSQKAHSIVVTLLSCDEAFGGGFGRTNVILEIDPSNFGLGDLQVGDHIKIQDQYGDDIGVGFVKNLVNNQTMVVNVDRDISRYLTLNSSNQQWSTKSRLGNVLSVYKDEMLTAFGLGRANIIQLYDPANDRLRGLLIGNKPPQFVETNINVSTCILNAQQQAAIRHCLAAQEYALVLGMPGTGKTTTLVELILLLAKMGNRILISSYTHSAVDNLLLKVKQRGLPVLRIGSADRVDKNLHEDLLTTENFPTVQEVTLAMQERRIVGASALGTNHIVLARSRFDYSIVDEASQVNVPSVIGPLLLSNRFILVGDHFQLPPLVKNEQSIVEGLDVSLFKLLAEKYPGSVATLSQQFRMCEDIQQLANRLIYGGRLRCGSLEVAQGRLETNLDSFFCNICGDGKDCWLRGALKAENRVLFLDTDLLSLQAEEAVAESYGNQTESRLINIIVTSMIACGIPANDLAVITAHRPQVRLIQSRLTVEGDVEVSTVDRFQGRDKECIILSLVRSNHEGKIGHLLTDWNRLNVAFTRARKKLILVGSYRTVLGHPQMVDLRTLFEEHGWLNQLPPNSMEHHNI